MRVPGTSLYKHPHPCTFFEAEISPCSVFWAIFTCVSRSACDCPRRIVKMPPMGFKHGKVVFGHDGTNSALRRVGVKGYAEMIKGAVVGIDLSSLLHGPLSTVDVKQVLTVNGGNSVLYLVASTLSDIFKAKLLDTARAIFLVCDPKRRDAHHCEACKGKYTTAYAKKCSCTGRNGAQGRTDKARAAYTAALAAFNEEISDDPDDQELRDAAGERLSAAFKKLMAATDTVTHALEDAVLHFAGEWNDKVREARALAAKGVAVPKKSEEQDWAHRPLIHCIGSPVEADDQLGYFVRVGLVQVVLATDTDLVCNGGLPCVAKGGVNNKAAVGKTPIFVYTKDSATERARLL